MLTERIADPDALFDPQSFPEFGRQEPRSYQRLQRRIEQLAEPSIEWSALQSAVADTLAPQPDAPVAVRAGGTPALAETDGKPYRTYAFLVDL